jgi:hypothetical protein
MRPSSLLSVNLEVQEVGDRTVSIGAVAALAMIYHYGAQ